MSGSIYLCVTEDECPRHGKFIYFCKECHEKWREKNPHTSEAISKGLSKGAINQARKKDENAKM